MATQPTHLAPETFDELAFATGIPAEIDEATNTAHLIVDGTEFVRTLGAA